MQLDSHSRPIESIRHAAQHKQHETYSIRDEINMSTHSDLQRRSSAFTEIGLEGHDSIIDQKIRVDRRPKLGVRFRSNVSIVEADAFDPEPSTAPKPNNLFLRLPLSHMALFIALLAIVLPTFHGSSNIVSPLAEAGVVRPRVDEVITLPEKRQNVDTAVCKRWSGQSAVVNGTMYYYGGRAMTSADQTSGTWSKSTR